MFKRVIIRSDRLLSQSCQRNRYSITIISAFSSIVQRTVHQCPCSLGFGPMLAMNVRQQLSDLLTSCETSYHALCSTTQLLTIDHSTRISCMLCGGIFKGIFIHRCMNTSIRDRPQRKFIFNHCSTPVKENNQHWWSFNTRKNKIHMIFEEDFVCMCFVLSCCYFSSRDVYDNGTLFIRPFREYSKALHAGTFACRAENSAGSIQTTSIQLKPRE
jgi:hypothetical protein